MAKFNSFEVYTVMKDTGIVPVFYDASTENCVNVLRSAWSGGIRVFEFTNRGERAHDVFLRLAEYRTADLPEMVLGAGSVVDAPTAALYIQSGADFIVGPCFNPEIARVCNRRSVPYIPGCMTPTEIGMAQEAGCQTVKIFPGDNSGGPSFVKNILAPMPWTNIMVTGGVNPTEESLREWFDAGVMCIGMGARLIPRLLVEEGRWGELTTACEQASRTVSGILRK